MGSCSCPDTLVFGHDPLCLTGVKGAARTRAVLARIDRALAEDGPGIETCVGLDDLLHRNGAMAEIQRRMAHQIDQELMSAFAVPGAVAGSPEWQEGARQRLLDMIHQQGLADLIDPVWEVHPELGQWRGEMRRYAMVDSLVVQPSSLVLLSGI